MADDYDIVSAFEAIEDELIASMIRNLRRHKIEEIKEDKQWAMWQADQLKSLEKYRRSNEKRFDTEFSKINAQIEGLILAAKDEGEMEQELQILRAIKNGFKAKKVSVGAKAEFFKLNERKLEALIKATTDDMQKAEIAVLRMANDQYRKIIYNAQVYANTGAGTYESAIDMATKDFLSAGLNCVEYSNGARHTLSGYARMAIRTASKRAYLQGEGQKRKEWGIPTVIVNKRGNPCPKCLPFCGKIMIDDVWSGGSRKDGPYPLMSDAVEAGLYHPNCKDSHSTYFEGINAPPDDKYTKNEITQIQDDYKKEQQERYAKRQEKKYKRLAEYSLDKHNQEKYAAKSRIWKSDVAIYREEKVYYNPESDYDIKIPEYADEVNRGLSDAIIDLAKRGTADGFEHMNLVNLSNGKLEFYETNQDEFSVGYEFWKMIKENPNTEYAFVHNHNRISSLSEADLITAATTKNIKIIIAVQNDGVIYYAKKTKDAPKDFWPDDYFEEELKELNLSLRNGKITAAERGRKREEIIIKSFLKEFFEGMVIIDGKRK